jgi:hypothetical protein
VSICSHLIVSWPLPRVLAGDWAASNRDQGQPYI